MNNENNFLDILAIISFVIAVQNLEENVSQSQMQETVRKAVTEIHEHLEIQDSKIDEILKILKGRGGF